MLNIDLIKTAHDGQPIKKQLPQATVWLVYRNGSEASFTMPRWQADILVGGIPECPEQFASVVSAWICPPGAMHPPHFAETATVPD